MLYLEAILLLCLTVCGFVCTVSDFRTTIVPNKIILSGFAIGIPIHVLLLCFDYAPYYPTWLINMLFADLLAFGMYWYKMWAAGDAKLFMLLYFLFPPRWLDSGSLAYSIVPYMYIFVPALLWILVDTVIRCLRREKKKSRVFQLKNSLLNFCIIMIESTAFSCLFIWLFSSFARENELFTSVIMIVYAFYCSSKPLMKKWPIVLTHVVVILLSYLVGEWAFSFNWQSQLKESISPAKVRYDEQCGSCKEYPACGGMFYSTYALGLCPVKPFSME